MKESIVKKGNQNRVTQEFESLDGFYKYICDTPFNSVFRWAKHSSVENGFSFTGTYNFEEATNLFRNGWDAQAKKLEQKLKLVAKEVQPKTVARSRFDVVGFQASVPRYLQGIPTSMVNKKQVPTKQKVITLNKSISYSAAVSKESIEQYSINALQIIKKVEAQGYRVNLNIIFGTEESKEAIIAKVRIKGAAERLNVSKVAFPLVHTSMLRRLLFRYIEVNPNVTDKGFTMGYGVPIKDDTLKAMYPDEYFLPKEIYDKDVDSIIKSLNLK